MVFPLREVPVWRAGNLCIVPADAVYEPCYEIGSKVRHKIWIASHAQEEYLATQRHEPTKGGADARRRQDTYGIAWMLCVANSRADFTASRCCLVFAYGDSLS
ncbi:hypothetical protein R8510_03458 [Ralstonia chuxiongensis]|nr:hypothetical protein R8510_03458 [Ralstonia chuxiongensis]